MGHIVDRVCNKLGVDLFGKVGTGRGRGQEQVEEELNLVDKWFTNDCFSSLFLTSYLY
jgi:hypothetical protein